MTLQDEALSYWKLCKKYRTSLTLAGKTYIANIEVPSLHLRASNPRIITNLFAIMSQEGVPHVEGQSTHPSV